MIEVTRICDTCHGKREQNIDPRDETVIFKVGFTCSNCILLKQAQQPEPQHIQDLVGRRKEEELQRRGSGRSSQRSNSDFI